MTRTSRPDLVDPYDVVSAATTRQFGILTMRDVMTEIDALKQQVTALQSAVAAKQTPSIHELLSGIELFSDPLNNIDFKYAQPIAGRAVKGTVTPTSITSTTGTSVVNFNLGPLIEGIPYLVIGEATLACNADPAGFIYSMIRIVNSGSGVDGMQTGTASGERSLSAPNTLIVWGNGTTINIAGRARLSAAGTGSVNDAEVWAIAIPLIFMAFRE